MTPAESLELLTIVSGWLVAAWALGERVETAMLPRRRRTAPPVQLTPASGLWVRGARTYPRSTTPAPRT